MTDPPEVTTIPTPPLFAQLNQVVVISPDGKFTYVTGGQPGDGRPLVIDSDPFSESFNSVVGRLETGPDPTTGIAISPSGAFVYVLNLDNHLVKKVGARSHVVEAQIALGPPGLLLNIALNLDGSIAFVTNYHDPGAVSVIRTSDMTLMAPPIPVERFPWGVVAR